MFPIEDFRAGQRLSAAALTAMEDELRRLGQLVAASPLTVHQESSGIAITWDGLETFAIKLTAAGTGGAYAWTRQQPAASGGWTNYPGFGQSGTTTVDPAYETSGNASVNLSPNPVVPAWRDPVTNTVRFSAGSC